MDVFESAMLRYLAFVGIIYVSACARSVTSPRAVPAVNPNPPTEPTPAARPLQVDAARVYLQTLGERGYSGVAVAAQGNAVVLEYATGTSDCAGNRPVQVGDVFLIGSITKVFTQAAMIKLADDGAASLNDPLARWLPSAPADKKNITLRQLIKHEAGLADILDDRGQPIQYTVDWDYIPVSRRQIEERVLASPLQFSPGAKRRYSNAGYSLLAAVIERVSATPYEHYVHDQLFAPAGMATTGYVIPDWSQRTLVEGCLGSGQRWGNPITDGRWMTDGPSWNLRGNGGMLGTAADLVRWLQAIRDSRFFSPNGKASFLTLAVGKSRTFQMQASAAAGGNGIFNAMYLWLVDSDIMVVMMSNRQGQRAEDHIIEFTEILTGRAGAGHPTRSGANLVTR
ncbi:MAG: beta-lactamase family protein [Proteobacteria bacterium]|nr:beta-lactamase family protein [Pseudomonadota bacterium]